MSKTFIIIYTRFPAKGVTLKSNFVCILDRGMRPAKDFQSVPQKDSNTRTRGVQKTIVTPLSALAEMLNNLKTKLYFGIFIIFGPCLLFIITMGG